MPTPTTSPTPLPLPALTKPSASVLTAATTTTTGVSPLQTGSTATPPGEAPRCWAPSMAQSFPALRPVHYPSFLVNASTSFALCVTTMARTPGAATDSAMPSTRNCTGTIPTFLVLTLELDC